MLIRDVKEIMYLHPPTSKVPAPHGDCEVCMGLYGTHLETFGLSDRW